MVRRFSTIAHKILLNNNSTLRRRIVFKLRIFCSQNVKISAKQIKKEKVLVATKTDCINRVKMVECQPLKFKKRESGNSFTDSGLG
jgi:hypothetical protein